jgi:hypothetical protein
MTALGIRGSYITQPTAVRLAARQISTTRMTGSGVSEHSRHCVGKPRLVDSRRNREDPISAIPGSYSPPQVPTFIQMCVIALHRRWNGEAWDFSVVPER